MNSLDHFSRKAYKKLVSEDRSSQNRIHGLELVHAVLTALDAPGQSPTTIELTDATGGDHQSACRTNLWSVTTRLVVLPECGERAELVKLLLDGQVRCCFAAGVSANLRPTIRCPAADLLPDQPVLCRIHGADVDGLPLAGAPRCF